MHSDPQTGVRPTSPLLYRVFRRIAEHNLRKHFQALRILKGSSIDAQAAPLILYLNHPSWWDPITCIALARHLLPTRSHYAPISAASLKRYRFFARIGMFPVQQDTPRGAAQFLRGAQAVLKANGVLWITAQGSFTDVRHRPTQLRSGLEALLKRTPGATVVPLAIEYSFWNAKLPEVLAACGEPVRGRTTPDLEQALQTMQDKLAAAALTRNPDLFQTILKGSGKTRLENR